MELKAKRKCLSMYDQDTTKLFTLAMEEDGLEAAGIKKLDLECNASFGWPSQLTFDLSRIVSAVSKPRATYKNIVKASCHWTFKVNGVLRKQNQVVFNSSGTKPNFCLLYDHWGLQHYKFISCSLGHNEGVLTGLKSSRVGREQVYSIVLGEGDKNLGLYRFCKHLKTVLTFEVELEVWFKLEHIKKTSEDNLHATGGLFALKRGDVTSDVTIKCSSGEFKAHKNVLACCSPVFARMLTSGMKESKRGVIQIHDFEAETIQDMITFLYGGTLHASTHSIVALLDCSEKYDIPELKAFVVNLMLANMTPDNATELASAAVKFGCDNGSMRGIFRYCKA